MMNQAFDEFGFEADDIPLIIEAIPVSGDCIILIVTKVEDPGRAGYPICQVFHIRGRQSGRGR